MPRPKKKLQTFHIVRLKASPAAFIGRVEADDETAAVKAAVKQYRIRPEDQRRVIAIRA